MGLKITIAVAVLMILCTATLSHGSWQGPTEILSVGWGTSDTNFGIEHGDTSDRFPSLAAILFDGRIVISDEVNEREVIYSSNGTLLKVVPWYVYQDSVKAANPDYPLYQYWNVQGYTPEGNVWIKISNYLLKSPTGQLIKTSTTRPLELGVEKSSLKQADGNYLTVIAYDDVTYSVKAPTKLGYFTRDMFGNLYAVIRTGSIGTMHSRVYKYSKCGKVLSFVDLPANNIIEEPDTIPPRPTPLLTVVAEYGSPVIAPNGDVYAWKRTANKYSILKWTWVADPNVPTGPEPPTGLTLTPSINGLYLTWKASPNDPGCVTKYEIARSATSGGVFSTVDTVEKGVLKYNDTTAETGTTYYYKVRAMAGSDLSLYTAEVSGKR